MKLQFVLVIYYLTLVRKSLVNYQYIHSYIYIQIYTLRIFQILRFLVALIFIRVHSPLFFCHFSTAIFHMRCPVADHSVTSQLRPFHTECPDPGHGTRNYVRFGIQVHQLINIYCLSSGFCSTSHFYIYIVCVDRSGSLSSSAFNQLRLATLNIVLTILY